MIDIADVSTDITFTKSQVGCAKNLLETQIGELSYAPKFGVDLEFFMQTEFKIQNESFEAYLLQKMGEWKLNVTKLVTSKGKFIKELNFIFDTKRG